MKSLAKDLVGLALVVFGGLGLLAKVSPWPCVAVVGLGGVLIDTDDIIKVLTTVAPFLSKYLPGGPPAP